MPLYRPFWLLCLLVSINLSLGNVVVETNHGPVQGQVKTYNGQSLKSFLGIPYAKPPVGQLRFKPPQEAEPWTVPLMTSEYSALCMQFPVPGVPSFYNKSEDCLYLNVFVPETVDNRSVPVMVWIHGGGLTVGTPQANPPEGMVLYGEVIVVSINYRLDIFGFFTTGSDAVVENIGMLDQVMALKWVKDNIARFGGDTDRITIFGESAGSWSVTTHLISPLSAGLFHRVIGESGSVQNFYLETGTDRFVTSKDFVDGLGCTFEDENVMVSCLQSKTTVEIMAQSYLTPYTTSFCPLSVGGSFLPLQPEIMWKTYTPSADLIIGLNSDEALIVLENVDLILGNGTLANILQNGINMMDPVFAMLATLTLGLFPSEIPSATLDSIVMAQYFGNIKEDDQIGILRSALDAASDRIFLSPTLLTAMSAASAGRDVYTYYFSEVTQTTALGDAIPFFFPYVAALNTGAAHTTELPYTMGEISAPNIPHSMYDLANEVDRNMSLSMMNAWTSFAKTGKPVFLSSDGSHVEWPQYQSNDTKYVEFRSPMSADSIKINLCAQADSFWNVLLPAVIAQYSVDEPGHSSTECPNQTDGMASMTDHRMRIITLLVLIASIVIITRQ